MNWNSKYWDIVTQIYWTPKYIGLDSIAQKHWTKTSEHVRVRRDLVNQNGPLYTRRLKQGDLIQHLSRKEEVLNHVFDITFAVASDDVLARLFCRPFGFDDGGPFQSHGREIRGRFGWGRFENVTQHDGFFTSSESIIGVELKLESHSWPEQIAKYVALGVWEEMFSGPREQIGLLYIVPDKSVPDHWRNCGLEACEIDHHFIAKLNAKKLPKKVRDLFATNRSAVASMFDRLKLAVVSWSDFRVAIDVIIAELDEHKSGDQTLRRLLAGFCAQMTMQKAADVKVEKSAIVA